MEASDIVDQSSGWRTVPVECGSGVSVALDVFTCRGHRPGATALVVGGIHGDEYEGPAAIWRVAESLHPEEITGAVILLPIASPLAWNAGTRFTPPDDVNLPRVFPGNPAGTPTERLAHFLFETFGRGCDYLIDLHSGGVEYDFVPIAGFRGEAADENPSFAAARAMGLGALWQLPDRPGVFSREVAQLGAVTVGAEYRGSGQLNRQGASDYAQGIRACLSRWGILTGPPVSGLSPQPVFASRWLLCPATGVFTSNLRLGDRFQAGDTLAEIRGPRGQVLAPVVAHEPGTALALRSKAYAREGDWAVLLGRILAT
ncbi:MAG: succinylglutamate desuccinylase/aspartoacylase family protein [Actinomycetota bacterium]